MHLRARMGWVYALAATIGLARPASAEPTISGTVDEVGQWIDAHHAPVECTEHCFLLERLLLRGDAKSAVLRFELTGDVLVPGARIIPILGDPASVRVTDTKVNGKPAAIGFENNYWFLRTAEGHFVVTGSVALGEDRELRVPGPVNLVDAQISGGHLTEGDHQNAAADLVVHVEAGEPSGQPDAETFDLSRAIRVGDKTTFEYHLAMTAGHDLGVQKLPLKNNEQVIQVDGAAGWSVEDGELVLKNAGHALTVVVRGVLPSLGAFTIDPRSASEWVLLESDLDHEVKVSGNSTAADVASSPIPPTASTSRAFRLMPRDSLELTSERRTSHDVLAAVVDRHARTAVLTAAGDLVMSDTLAYDNSALDVIRLHTHARPIFLAVDGVPERMLHEAEDPAKSDEVAVPLRAGYHSVRLQSLGQDSIAWLGGRLRIPMPDQPLTTSTATVSVGLPARVHPVATTGGERASFLVGGFRDALALVLSAVAACVVFGRRRMRVVGALVLFGLWWVSPAAFVSGVGIGLAALGARWCAGRWTGWPLRFACAAGAAMLVALTLTVSRSVTDAREAEQTKLTEPPWEDRPRSAIALPEAMLQAEADSVAPAASAHAMGGMGGMRQAANFGMIGLLPTGSTLKGVTPVELPMPGAATHVEITRELVTGDRPFVPTVWYVTDALVWFLGGLWLAGIAWLGWCCREALVRLREGVRRLARPRAPSTEPIAGAI